MSRRLLWSCIAVVLLLLVGASLMANGLGDESAMREQFEAAVTWVRTHPEILLGVFGGIVVVLLIRGGARRRVLRPELESADEDESADFGDVLEDAMRPGGGSGRRSSVIAMHREGRSVGEIAKATRLSQDAVRAVIEGG